MDALNYLFDIPVTSLFIGILFPLILYWYSTRNHDYWKKRGIPFAKAYPFLGSRTLRKNIEDVELERYNRFGRLYGHYEANIPVLSVSDPEHVKNILVKDFQYFTTRRIFNSSDPIADKMLSIIRGEDWRRIRMIVSPTFTTGKIKRLMSIFQDCSKTLIQNYKIASVAGDPVDVIKIYGAFTMDVIASSAFSTKLDSHNDPENEFIKKAKAAFSLKIGFRFLLFLFMPKVMQMLKIRLFDPENMEFFKKVTLEIMEERKKTGQTRNDFLQLLMDSAKEVAKEEKLDEKSEDITGNYVDNESVDQPVFNNTLSKHLSLDELVAQCVIFFLAGYHTTATTLGFATYLLAHYPIEQEKLFNEIKEVLAENNGELTYESIQKMKYLDNVISETLRMYSPVVRLDRTADMDYKLGDTGIIIPKGMPVTIPVFAIHRDPKFFPEAEKFKPDRFSAEEKGKSIPYSYLPFGAGPRNCVGMRFALIEVKVCLVHVLSNFQVKKCTESEKPIEFGRAAGLLQPKSIMLQMEPRNDCPLKS